MRFSRAQYRKRILDGQLNKYLEAFGAVCVEGPKACGKTWFSMNKCNSSFMLADQTGNFLNLQLAKLDINEAFKGDRPHLIDEWQDVPEIWDATKNIVDETDESGQFILTGSSTPVLKGIRHSGAGRIGILKLRTMSLFESGDSTGVVSLRELFDEGINTTVTGNVEFRNLVDLTVRGGWPQLIGKQSDIATLSLQGYVDRIVDDAAKLDGKIRNKEKIRMTFRSLARNESTLASLIRITSDVSDMENDGSASFNKEITATEKTVREYIDLLDRLFLIENQTSFSPNVKSDLRVGKAPKRHFTDPSLAIAALGFGADRLYSDPCLYGMFFEAMCERDLAIYLQAMGGKLFHYRAGSMEIDAVAELADGRYGLFEIKLGTHEIDAASDNLIRIVNKWKDNGLERNPEFLCVICGMSGAAYRRPDGTYVVPITALGP